MYFMVPENTFVIIWTLFEINSRWIISYFFFDDLDCSLCTDPNPHIFLNILKLFDSILILLHYKKRFLRFIDLK